MDKRETQKSSESPPRKKLIKRKRPSLTLRKKKKSRRLRHKDLKRIAAEVVDSEPKHMIERLKSYGATEFEVMRVPPLIYLSITSKRSARSV